MRIFISHTRAEGGPADSLMQALAQAGHDPVRADTSLGGSADVTAAIVTAIRTADALVAFPGAGNANVFFEVGLATGADIPSLLIAAPDTDLPSDLGSAPLVRRADHQDWTDVVRRIEALPWQHRAAATRERDVIELVDATRSEILASLDQLSQRAFEELVLSLLTRQGFEVARPAAPDRGRDLELKQVAPVPGIVIVECKKWGADRRIGADVVRALLGQVSFSDALAGLLVSTSDFTAAARAIADSTSRVSLIRIEELLERAQVPE